MTPLEKTLQFTNGFLLDFIPGNFYFVDFASDSFTVINYGHKYDYMESSESSKRITELGRSSGIFQHK